ncbi:MAG: Gldg family protein [Planctomycetota bacterium]|nr:Gldg family protein [Planctomycetota bacterium]
MSRRDALALALLLVLSAGVAVYATRVTRHHQTGGAFRAEVGRLKLSTLEPATLDRLARLEDELVVTYYVSNRSLMPSHMKRLERDVTDLLQAMRTAAPQLFEYHLVDPDDPDPDRKGDLVRYASRRKVSPVRVRSVERDSWSERLVWSSLTLSYGARPEVIVNGVTPEHLPRLQRMIVAHLDQLEAPRAPVIALSAPPGFADLARDLAQYGEVHEVDLDAGAAFPADADVLFWMRPRRVTPARLRELQRFLARGRSVVTAGSLYRLGGESIFDRDGEPWMRAEPSGFAADTLYAEFGLRPLRALVLDERCEAILWREEQQPANFLVRCIAPNQDFERWRNQPNGHLLFAAATPIELDGDVLAARGWEASVLATTSDHTWLQREPLDGPRRLADMGEENGEPATKLALIVALEHADPWRGTFVACAASTPFEDGLLNRQGVAHWRLVKTLIGELTSSERLVAARAEVERPEPIPVLSSSSRLVWRVAVVFLLPAAFAALGLTRGAVRAGSGRRRHGTRGAGVWTRLVLGLVVALVAVRAVGSLDLRADATDDDANSLAPETRAIAARAGELGEIDVELCFSSHDRLPPDMRRSVGRVRGRLRDLERAGAALDVTNVHPEDLDQIEREALAAEGRGPVHVTTRDEELITVRTVYSSIRLARGDRVEVLRFDDAPSFELLEFRLAFALWRLETGEHPTVAFAADAERPAASIAFEEYQQKGLFAPKGTDHFNLARTLLGRCDFEVVNVTPRDFMGKPDVPDDVDVLVWMQPRRSIEAMMEETVRYLVGGGSVLIAAQHFQIMSEQFRGRGFQMSYWPEPQSPDVEQLYFPELGVELVREVLFDKLATEIDTDTKIVGRGRPRDHDKQTSARPFQIRASAANFADHPVTRNLGDQAFIWANHFVLDEARLAEHGLAATTLIHTSERTWTYAWKGGFIEEAEDGTSPLDGPARDQDGEPQWLGRVPLAVVVEGRFPLPEGRLELSFGMPGTAPQEPEAEDQVPVDPYPPSAPGRLLMIGCSEVFKDHLFEHAELHGDHLLLNAVAFLALPSELSAIASRRPVVRGFDYVEPETRIRWRSFVLVASPMGLVLLGLCWSFARRRSAA